MPAPITPMREDRLRTSTSGAKAGEDTADWLTDWLLSLRCDPAGNWDVSATGNARIRTLTFPPPPVNQALHHPRRRRREGTTGACPIRFQGRNHVPQIHRRPG